MITRQYLERLPRYLTMRQMRILAAISEHGSVLRASRELRVAQPAVSRALADLEGALGVKLFDRSPRGMTLTVFGEALLRRVKTIFGELRDADDELMSLREGWYGHVQVGCTRLLCAGVLPRLLSLLIRERPGLNLSVVEGDTNALLRELRDRNLDVVLGRFPDPGIREDDLEYQFLFQERFLLVTGIDHPLARRRRVSIRDALAEPWVFPLRSSMPFRTIQETFGRYHQPLPAARVHTESIDVTLELVEGGEMITIIPASVLSDKARRYRLKIIPPVDPIEYGPVGYMTLRGRQPTPAMKSLAAFLRSELGKLLGGSLRQMASGPAASTKRGLPPARPRPASGR